MQRYDDVMAWFRCIASYDAVIPSLLVVHYALCKSGYNQNLSLALSFLLLLAYVLRLWFSLNTHRELFASAAEEHEAAWPIGLALVTLAVVTILVALVSEVFVGSV